MPTVRDHLILQLEKVVEEACAKETNVFGYGIWTHHIREVVCHARQLASVFGADLEIVEIAALLHDYAAIKDQRLIEDHHLHGATEARRILEQFGYPRDKIEAVEHCVLVHRGREPRERQTPEAECLANADAMAHLEQVPSLLFLAYVRHGMSIEEGTRWVREKLDRSWNKLSPLVQEMMAATRDAALKTLERP
jgi:putative nucleotidyltransferase with HDIG domain